MKSGIYIITCLLNNNHYIGRAKDWKKRLRAHYSFLTRNSHANSHLQNAVNLYGIENFSFDILDECEEDSLCAMEHYWCNILNSHNREYGYNIEPTSPFCRVGHADETKLKISNIQKNNPIFGENHHRFGIPHTDECRKRMSEAQKGLKRSKESIEKGVSTRKINAEERGYYLSEEHKRRIGESNKKPKSKEHVESMIRCNNKKVAIEMYDMDWNYIKDFDSLSDARRELGCAVNLIYIALNNPNRSAKGFKFKYKNK